VQGIRTYQNSAHSHHLSGFNGAVRVNPVSGRKWPGSRLWTKQKDTWCDTAGLASIRQARPQTSC